MVFGEVKTKICFSRILSNQGCVCFLTNIFSFLNVSQVEKMCCDSSFFMF